MPYPPPPAEVEEMSYRHDDDDCVWIDGYYAWNGRWVWQRGKWVLPPADCYYAPSVVAWSRTAEPRLYFTPPRWFKNDAIALSESQAVCPAPKACR